MTPGALHTCGPLKVPLSLTTARGWVTRDHGIHVKSGQTLSGHWGKAKAIIVTVTRLIAGAPDWIRRDGFRLDYSVKRGGVLYYLEIVEMSFDEGKIANGFRGPA